MSPRPFRRVAAVAAAVLSLGLLSGPASAAGRSPITVGSLTLQPCATSTLAWCTTTTVPFDYSDPGAGTIDQYFEWYPATGTAQGTVLAVEGGPGYPTTGTRDDYLGMLGPLTKTRNVLMIDLRGTGKSGVMKCPKLQNFTADQGIQAYIDAVGACGNKLDTTWKRPDGSFVHGSDLFTTANEARDVANLLDRLKPGKVDLYGDSYGTFFGQAFTARYASKLRSVVLDAAFPVAGGDPFYPDAIAQIRTSFDLACRRSTGCAASTSIQQMAAAVRATPITGSTRPPGGAPAATTVDVNALEELVQSAGSDSEVYRELVPAIRAYLDHGDTVPILRLTARFVTNDDSGPVADFSAGTYATVSCNDYPQAYRYTGNRRQEYERSVAALRTDLFSPFTVPEWVTNGFEEFDACLQWPTPVSDDPPVTTGGPLAPADLPVLVMTGDLDSLTTPAEGRRAAALMGPQATWIQIANKTHVSALLDTDGCASGLVRTFMTHPEKALDASCATRTPEVRLVPSYPSTMAQAAPAHPGQGNTAKPDALRLASIGADTVQDAIAQWPYLPDVKGFGLRGGSFTFGGADPDSTTISFSGDRWTGDATVSGIATWNQTTGHVTANLTVTGPDGLTATVAVTYDDFTPHAVIHLTGTSGGQQIVATR